MRAIPVFLSNLNWTVLGQSEQSLNQNVGWPKGTKLDVLNFEVQRNVIYLASTLMVLA